MEYTAGNHTYRKRKYIIYNKDKMAIEIDTRSYCINCMKPIRSDAKCDCGFKSQGYINKQYYLPIGTAFRNRYYVGKVLQERGMYIEYMCFDTFYEKKVILKEFYPEGMVIRDYKNTNELSTEANADLEKYQRFADIFFEDASRKVKFSKKDGFIAYYDCFKWNNTVYIVTEYVEGEILKTYCRKKSTLTYKETLDIMMPVIDAIDQTYNENYNYFFYKLSPENVLITKDGRGKLIDIDIVVDVNKNKIRQPIIYPGYNAVEQYGKKTEIGQWTNVYTICSIMYYCMTGIVPTNAIERSISDDIEPIHALVPACEIKYSNAIMKGMAIKKDNRYLTLKELSDALIKGEEISDRANKMKSEKSRWLLSFFTRGKNENKSRQVDRNILKKTTGNNDANSINSSMAYKQIMNQIRAGLSGDSKKDILYLRNQCQAYRNHSLSQEILRECGRMMAELIPDDVKEEYANIVRGEENKIESVLEEVHYAVYKKDYNKALNLLEGLVGKADNNPMYKDDSVNAYFNFGEYFEELIYKQVNSSQKEIRMVQFPFASIYLNYGSLLVETGRYEEANAVLKKAIKWNPVNIGIRSEYMETLKKLGRFDEYYKMAVESFRYAFKSKDIARCYRNIGWYFVEMKLYKEAMGVYMLSLKYDNNSTAAQSEMFFIQQMDASVSVPNLEELKIICERHGFSTEADATVLSCALSGVINSEVNGMTDGARYFCEILYDLTGAEEIKEMLDTLQK